MSKVTVLLLVVILATAARAVPQGPPVEVEAEVETGRSREHLNSIFCDEEDRELGDQILFLQNLCREKKYYEITEPLLEPLPDCKVEHCDLDTSIYYFCIAPKKTGITVKEFSTEFCVLFKESLEGSEER